MLAARNTSHKMTKMEVLMQACCWELSSKPMQFWKNMLLVENKNTSILLQKFLAPEEPLAEQMLLSTTMLLIFAIIMFLVFATISFAQLMKWVAVQWRFACCIRDNMPKQTPPTCCFIPLILSISTMLDNLSGEERWKRCQEHFVSTAICLSLTWC